MCVCVYVQSSGFLRLSCCGSMAEDDLSRTRGFDPKIVLFLSAVNRMHLHVHFQCLELQLYFCLLPTNTLLKYSSQKCTAIKFYLIQFHHFAYFPPLSVTAKAWWYWFLVS